MVFSNGLQESVIQICIFWLFFSGNFSLSFSLWLLFVLPTNLSHIYLILWIIGWAIGCLSTKLVDFESNELAVILNCAVSAAFFNTVMIKVNILLEYFRVIRIRYQLFRLHQDIWVLTLIIRF